MRKELSSWLHALYGRKYPQEYREQTSEIYSSMVNLQKKLVANYQPNDTQEQELPAYQYNIQNMRFMLLCTNLLRTLKEAPENETLRSAL